MILASDYVVNDAPTERITTLFPATQVFTDDLQFLNQQHKNIGITDLDKNLYSVIIFMETMKKKIAPLRTDVFLSKIS